MVCRARPGFSLWICLHSKNIPVSHDAEVPARYAGIQPAIPVTEAGQSIFICSVLTVPCSLCCIDMSNEKNFTGKIIADRF